MVPAGLEIGQRRNRQKTGRDKDPNTDCFFIMAPEGVSTADERERFRDRVMDLWMLEGVVSRDNVVILDRREGGYTTSEIFTMLTDKFGRTVKISNTGLRCAGGKLEYDAEAEAKQLLQVDISEKAACNLDQYKVLVNLLFTRNRQGQAFQADGLERVRGALYLYMPAARAVDLEREVRSYYDRYRGEVLVRA